MMTIIMNISPVTSSQCRLKETHPRSWVDGWVCDLHLMVQLESSLRSEASQVLPTPSDFCFLYILHLLAYTFVIGPELAEYQALCARTMLIIQTPEPEPLVKFLCYSMCCTQNCRVWELEGTLESEIYSAHPITQMSSLFYQHLVHLLCLLFHLDMYYLYKTSLCSR